MWRERKWRKLANLIDKLPRWSLYQEAKAKDPELALLLEGIESPEFERRFSEWTPLVEAIASLHDLLAIYVANQRTTDVAKFPRPVSAWERSHDRLRVESYHAAIAFLFPDGYKQ